ncbi:DUF4148 domain-containing protein [Paraburkholderia humisilvae]|uniref:DUF4148 domain-containing protein n=1 Tax=Paraburkholderia humisilvae TaxID=627669 RepID=A0A6J5F7T0_9BURK|nr:DUF4148 domain-containing protein [Paraburkholderia humisilvae]CAB3774433.1 hypothetical protein LMG29542_07810 [Paraburkholderia humisilvae]
MEALRAFTIATLLALSAAALVPTASAQGITRAEVRQQLIAAENSGSRLVTETSYPNTGLIYSHRVKRATEQAGDTGGTPVGTSQTGKLPRNSSHNRTSADCVGPVSFCNIYFGD